MITNKSITNKPNIASNYVEIPEDVVVSTHDGRHLVLARKGQKISRAEEFQLSKKIEKYGGLAKKEVLPDQNEADEQTEEDISVETSSKNKGRQGSQNKSKIPSENKSEKPEKAEETE